MRYTQNRQRGTDPRRPYPWATTDSAPQSPTTATAHKYEHPTHRRPRSASSRCVPLPSNLLLPELFHHHQRVKIRALNPEGTRHHAVRLEAELPCHVDCRLRHIIPLD